MALEESQTNYRRPNSRALGRLGSHLGMCSAPIQAAKPEVDGIYKLRV